MLTFLWFRVPPRANTLWVYRVNQKKNRSNWCCCGRIFKQIIAESMRLFFGSTKCVRYDFPHFHSFTRKPRGYPIASSSSNGTTERPPSSIVVVVVAVVFDVVNVWRKNQSSVHRVYLIRFIDGFLERTMADLFSPLLTTTFFFLSLTNRVEFEDTLFRGPQ